MENTIYDRIKMVRESKNMSQAEFSKFLGMGHSTLGMIEVGKRNILDRHIKTICSLCSVNENWLRNGIGEMNTETDRTIITSLASEYELDSLDQKIIECYLNLGSLQRKVIKDYLRNLVDAVLSDENYEEYRDEYIKDYSGSVADRNGDTDKIDELTELYDNRNGGDEK